MTLRRPHLIPAVAWMCALTALGVPRAAAQEVPAPLPTVAPQEPLPPPGPQGDVSSVSPRAPVSREAAAHARYQIRIMEGVLESAVQHGAQITSIHMRPLSPDLIVFTGPARARGYRLEGYGVFFSVDVPAVRRSLSWSYRTLNQSGLEMSRALQSLRRAVQTQADTRTRTELEQALRLVELQVGPVAPALAGQAVSGPQGGPDAARAAAEAVLDVEQAPPRDPDTAYEEEVKSALVDAMLDYGSPLAIGEDEWLTVAARDNQDRALSTDLAETVTIVLRIRGADLSAFRGGQLSRDDARQRVQVREF